MLYGEPFDTDTITDDEGAVYEVSLGTVIKADADWRIVHTGKNHHDRGQERLTVVKMQDNVDYTLAASPAAILYHQTSSRHFADAVIPGRTMQQRLNQAINQKGYEADADIAEMMARVAGGIAVSTTNIRNTLLEEIKAIPGLSDGKLSNKFFMIVGTPYQVESKPQRLPSRDWIDHDRSYEAHECDEKGMLIAEEGLKIKFMLSDDPEDNSAVLQKPIIFGQREPRKNRASDGAYYSREMKPPVAVWHHE